MDEAEANNHALLAMIRKHGLETAWIQQTANSHSSSLNARGVSGTPTTPLHPAIAAGVAASSSAPGAAAAAFGADAADGAAHGFGFAESRGKSIQAVSVLPLAMPLPAVAAGGATSAAAAAAVLQYGNSLAEQPTSHTSTASSATSVASHPSPGQPGMAAPPAGQQALTDLSGDDAMLLSSVSAAQTHFIITDPTLPDNPIVFASAGFYHLTGYGPEDILGHNCRFLQGRDTDSRTVARLSKAVQAGIDCRAVVLNYTKTGVPFWNDLFVAPLKDRDGQVVHFVGVQSNISPARAKALLELMGPYGGVVTSEPLASDAISTAVGSAHVGGATLAHGMSDKQLRAAVQAQSART